jgi:hypothetical protein
MPPFRKHNLSPNPNMAGAPPPFNRSYWIVPGIFCAGFYPGDREPSKCDEKLGLLLDAGIRHVVNLLEEHEVDFCGRTFDPYRTALLSLAQEKGVEITMSRFPVQDLGVPKREGMKAILDDIDRAIDSGRPVYLHCWGGLGRTGTVVGCWLARHGISRKKGALRKLAELRMSAANAGQESPQTAQQRRMVVEWQKGE